MGAIIASIFLGMAAPLAVFIPFTPVPFVFQMQLAFIFAAMLGPYYSVVMVGSFLLQGFVGLPVFAGGCAGSLLSPSLGYLIGYLFAARYMGYAFAGEKMSYTKSYFHVCMANLIVYAFGVCYLQMFVGPYNALLYGVVPFIVPDLMKNIFAARFIAPLKSVYESAA